MQLPTNLLATLVIISLLIAPLAATPSTSDYIKNKVKLINIDWDQESICEPDLAGLSIPITEIQSSVTGHAEKVIRQHTYLHESDTISYASIGSTASELTQADTTFDVLAKSTTLDGSAAYSYNKAYASSKLATFDEEVGTYYTTQNLNATVPALPASASSSISHDNFLKDAYITTSLNASTDVTADSQPTTVTLTGAVMDNTGEGPATGVSFLETNAHVTQSLGNLNVTDDTDFRDYTELINGLQYKFDNYYKLKNSPDGITIDKFNTTVTKGNYNGR